MIRSRFVLKLRIRRHLAADDCSHIDTTSYPNSGLERVVCRSCGNVSVRYLYAVIECDIDLPDSEPTSMEVGDA